MYTVEFVIKAYLLTYFTYFYYYYLLLTSDHCQKTTQLAEFPYTVHPLAQLTGGCVYLPAATGADGRRALSAGRRHAFANQTVPPTPSDATTPALLPSRNQPTRRLSASCWVLSGVRGVLAGIRGVLAGVRGVLAGVRGVLSGVRGVLSGVRGVLSGVRGVLAG